MKSSDCILVIGIWVWEAGVLSDEVFHSQDTTHPAGIIAEEDTAESCKGAYQISSGGDGRFQTGGVGGTTDDNRGSSSSGHDGGDCWR